MKTVNELLNTMEFRKNQTWLAKALNVNRTTLRKYMLDIGGEHHEIRHRKGKMQLMVLTSKAKVKGCK